MKKTMKILGLSTILSLGMCTAAFAGEDTLTTPGDVADSDGNGGAINVLGGPINLDPPTYSVDVEWGNMEFLYETTRKWDKATHTWENDPDKTPVWKPDLNAGDPMPTNQIKVTNDSSTKALLTFAFAPEATDSNITETCTGVFSADADSYAVPLTEVTIPAPVGGTDQIQDVYFHMTGGKLSADAPSGKTLGALTITFIGDTYS